MRHLLTFLFLTAIHHSAIAQEEDCIDPSQIDPEMFCLMIYDPVCGCDGVTYDNDCIAYYQGGVTSWTPGECDPEANECIDPSLINPDLSCLDVWEPVCGCDGETYSNGCYAANFAGVSQWTEGECETSSVPPCTDLTGLDFGQCDMFLGYAMVDGGCVPMSGCDWTVGEVDYSGAFLSSQEECEMTCADIQPVEPCTDLAGVDFGMCAMVLGVAVVDNQCQAISGCSTVVGNVDYSAAIFSSMEECQSCIISVSELDKDGISLYPNPANDRLTVRHGPSRGAWLTVTDLSGREMLRKRADAERTVIDISALAPGAYLVRFPADGRVRTMRFTKN